MHLSTGRFGTALLVCALIALGAACSSSNKNNNTGSNTNSSTTSSTGAASPITAANATAALTATSPAVLTPVSTPAVVATATAGVAARTATPSAAGLASPAARPAGSPSVSVAGGTVDPAVQAQLVAAALKTSDLPSGFSANGEPEQDVTLPGQVASYSQTYTSIGQGSSGLNVQAIVVALSAFKDQATAQSQFQDIMNAVSQQTGAEITLEPVPNGPTIGDQTVSFKVSGQTSGLNVAGYAIIWRRGKTAAALIQVGVPAPPSIDSLTPLAQKQDNNLKSIS